MGRKTHKQYVDDLNKVNPHLHILSTYINNKTKITIQDDRCGHIWDVVPNVLLSGKCSCSKCNCTKGENRIIKFLEDNNIDYIFQKSFDDLKYKNTLFYDFYIPFSNTLIEYDGEFHYEDIFGNGTFENAKKRDDIKNEYARKNNITLIRIPYWDFDNIETILSARLIA